jgi:hypothetical protein
MRNTSADRGCDWMQERWEKKLELCSNSATRPPLGEAHGPVIGPVCLRYLLLRYDFPPAIALFIFDVLANLSTFSSRHVEALIFFICCASAVLGPLRSPCPVQLGPSDAIGPSTFQHSLPGFPCCWK